MASLNTTVPSSRRSTPSSTSFAYFFGCTLAVLSAPPCSKHRTNLINLEHNIGSQVFKFGAKIKPVARLPERILNIRLKKLKLKGRQAEPLTNLLDDVEWAGPVKIGTPGSEHLINFDTGSADLWVPSAECKSDVCADKSQYVANASSTSTKKEGRFSIQYGDGSTVSGPIFTDNGEPLRRNHRQVRR